MVDDCFVVNLVMAGLFGVFSVDRGDKVDERGAGSGRLEDGPLEEMVACYFVWVLEVCGARISVGDLCVVVLRNFEGLRCDVLSVVGVVQIGGTSGVSNDRPSAFVRNVVGAFVFLASPF